MHEVGRKSRGSTAGGRLDILVQREGANLLVVEVKREELPLSNDDREQAISYARLVHPIAPYALVTNGRRFALYDTITKERVELANARFDELEVSLPDALYIDAQRTFFRLDSRNLVSFCRAESRRELEMVCGALEDGKKYVAELHVRREYLHQEVATFVKSEANVLIVSGASGLGKTCELVALTEERLNSEKPTLFFNGKMLESDLTGALSDAFYWHVDSDLRPAAAVRRMSSLLSEDEILLVLIDAIDEWPAGTRRSHLSNFASHLQGHKVKVIASCRTGALEDFIRIADDLTFVGRAARTIDVRPFDSEEFHKAVEKYKQAYKANVWFEAEALELARQSPFFMRILFETAKPGITICLTTDSVSVFEDYLSRILRKTGDQQRAVETIKAVGEVLYRKNTGVAPESEVRSALGLSPNEHLMEALFEQNILVRASVSVGDENISFYFDQLRNYVIAFKSLRFDQRHAETTIEEVRAVDFSTMQGEVHRFFYRLASENAKLPYDRLHRMQAEAYLEEYSRIV